MICAYEEMYLDDAMRNLGEMLDHAVLACDMDIDEFFQLFLASGIADMFGKGAPQYVSGRSGTELAIMVIEKAGMDVKCRKARIDYSCSPEYWCGWILAYYQWYTGLSFKEIYEKVSLKDIERLYPTLHEAPERKFVDVMNQWMRVKSYETRLQALRKKAGFSQKTLAEKAGVNLRTLQQYEIRAKDINKAAVTTLFSIAKVLGCRIEDLMEKQVTE